MTDSNSYEKASRPRRKATVLVVGVALALGGAFGVQAFASSKTFSHMKLAMTAEDGGFYKAHWRGGHKHGRFAEMSEAEINKKVSRMVRHVAIEIDATKEQTDKITALVSAVAMDMKPLHGTFKAAGKQFHTILLATEIDRAALEKIRAERVAEADRISKTMVKTLADVAEVLSIEQRKVLDERIKEFKSKRGHWRRG